MRHLLLDLGRSMRYDLRQFLYVLYQTTRASYLAQEKNSSLGLIWHLLNPLFMTAVLFGVLYWCAFRDHHVLVLLCFLSIFGSVMVSYTRARAEGLNMSCKVGVFTRMERFVVLTLMLFTKQLTVGLTLDSGFDLGETVSLAWDIRSIPATSIKSTSLPTRQQVTEDGLLTAIPKRDPVEFARSVLTSG